MINKEYNVAVVGATGLVGETMIELLEERNFPVGQLFPVASERSAGKTIMFRNKPVLVEALNEFDFSKATIALFSAGGDISEQFAPKAVESGCVVIDNTSCFRYHDDIPLVVPEVNGDKIANYKQRGIIANPNCSTIQMLVALKPIHDVATISRINVSTYQSVSGAGKKGISELATQTGKLLNGVNTEPEVFTTQIAFNAIPHIDSFEKNGYTREEMKMVWETQKIFADSSIKVNPTCVRIPVFFGHAEAVHIETKKKLTIEQAKGLLSDAPGVVLVDELSDGGYPTQVTEATGKDDVYVGRVREDISTENGINLWIVADNVRKGAALNTIQIAERLIDSFFEC